MKEKAKAAQKERQTKQKKGREKGREKPLSKKQKRKQAQWRPTPPMHAEYVEGWINRTSHAIHHFLLRLFSNLRFSLSLRISANYARLLLRMYVGNLVWLFAAFCVWQAPMLLARNAEIVHGAPDFFLHQDSVRAEWLPGPAPESDDWLDNNVFRYLGPVRGFTFEGWRPILTLEETVIHAGELYRVRTIHDLTGLCILFGQLMLGLFVFDILRAFGFLVGGRRHNRRLLQPIADITAHAQMLSENELSLRLNVAGAKNELKDLATVFNAMLDRIEAAYNGQKQFVSDASHELRTPIAVIQGYGNLLERWAKDDPKVRDEAISAIVNETGNMKDLVEKLLFLARHDKQTFKLNLEHFELRELVEETVRETEMITANHSVETGELSSGILYADRNAIKQAVRVFIDNAVKYTPPGGVIRIACERTPGTVTIAVSDNGQGIASADLPNVFDRFYRADAARSGKTNGHGLGLAIARIIVSSHNGKIRVTSQKGVGSTFRIILPN
ncbi:MAG: HAMP domain-containing histidine kinase [Clostridia bacterium]|nr:HAMP domain-containing histidine kinase [Clostridia bacterium]